MNYEKEGEQPCLRELKCGEYAFSDTIKMLMLLFCGSHLKYFNVFMLATDDPSA